MITFLLISISFCFGFLMCAILANSRMSLEIEMYEMGIILRDKTIHNQKLKIAEQAEKICNLKDSVTYYKEYHNENSN